MKAVVYREYGPPDVVRLEEVERPAAGDGQVLVRVHATSVTTADWRLRASAFPGITWLPGRLMFGLVRPRRPVLGTEFAGRVEAVGRGVARFAAGDRVFGVSGFGAHAEFVAVPEAGAIAAMPEELGFEQAAGVPFGSLAALVFLRDFGRLQPGQRVLVVGASGGVGVYAVQLARHLGAKVTGVASTGNLELVRELGAAHVVDYTAEPIARPGDGYDLIVDTVGATTYPQCREALAPEGRFVPLNFGLGELMQAAGARLSGRRRVVIGINEDRREDLEFIRDRLAAGEIRPVIDRTYPLDRIAEAYAYVEDRHRRGGVVVTVVSERAA